MKRETIFQSKHLVVTGFNCGSSNLIIGYDVWRHNRNGFPDVNPSHYFAAQKVSYLSIHSKENDWFLNHDLKQVRSALYDYTSQFSKVTAIGFSMGGYGALLLSRETRVNQVFLVSPQISISPKIAPYETRYLAEASKLDLSLDTVTTKPRRGLRGLLLFDPAHTIDAKHAMEIAKYYPNLTQVPLPFSGHPAMRVIREANLFGLVQEELLKNSLKAKRLLRIHKEARKNSNTYMTSLNRYLHDRSLLNA